MSKPGGPGGPDIAALQGAGAFGGAGNSNVQGPANSLPYLDVSSKMQHGVGGDGIDFGFFYKTDLNTLPIQGFLDQSFTDYSFEHFAFTIARSDQVEGQFLGDMAGLNLSPSKQLNFSAPITPFGRQQGGQSMTVT